MEANGLFRIMENDTPSKYYTGPIEFEDVDFYERSEEVKEASSQMLCFRLGEEFYAIGILNVLEVIRVSKMTYLPSSPSYIAGICNLRGNIISVTDPGRLFGLEGETTRTDRSRIIVVAHGEIETGLLVNEVLFVEEVKESRIEPPLSTVDSEKTRYMKGKFRHGGRLFTVLDSLALLESTRVKTEK